MTFFWLQNQRCLNSKKNDKAAWQFNPITWINILPEEKGIIETHKMNETDNTNNTNGTYDKNDTKDTNNTTKHQNKRNE